MKKLKRFACLFLVAALMIMCLPMPFRASAVATTVANGTFTDSFYDPVTWTLYSDGKLVLSGTSSMFVQFTATTAGGWTEEYYQQVKHIVIEDGITDVINDAFVGCPNLTNVTIADSVIEIGDYAFSNCKNLKAINWGNGITYIGSWAFLGCDFETVTIPASLTRLGESAIPVSKAYYVQEGNAAFSVDVNGALYNADKTTLVAVPKNFTGDFVCPDTVTEISSYAFSDCKNLTGVKIPDTVTRISNGAFSGCSAMESIKLPSNLTNLNYYLFNDCTSLTSLVIPKDVKKAYGHVIKGCSNLSNVYVMGRNTEFTNNWFSGEDITVYGYAGSTIETFANTWQLTFIPFDGNLTIIPDVSDSNYTIGSNGVCTVYCSGLITDFQSVLMDGNTVGDSNYTVEAGSTLVKFKANYLDTLTEGEHTVTLIYTSGNVSTTINIAANTCEHIYDNTCDPSCNLCGATRTVTHSWGAITSNDAQHWYECTVCGEEKDRENHHGGTATCKEKAVCTTCGTAYGDFAKCSYTAEVTETKYLNAAATCNTKAIYYKSCPVCGSIGTDTFTAGEFDKTNHKGETEIRGSVPATCGDPGYTGDTYCLDCNTKIANGTATNATGQHSGGTATCKEKAVCTTCGTAYGDLAMCEYTEEIAAAKYLKAAATCKDKAVYYKSCKVCGGVGTETFIYGEVDATNHTGGTEIRDAVAANCSKPGYTGDTYCLGCNTKIATGTATEKNDNHSGGTATCKEKAVCTVCGETYGDFAKHSYTEYKANNDATCEKDGTKTATCAYGCGTTDTAADVGSAKGHDFKTYTSDKNATCKADGTKTAKCENCDKTNTVADEGSKADHSYGDDNFCDWCGKDKSNPQTGDNTNLVLLTSVMILSLFAIAVLFCIGQRKAQTR